ncbi:ankyrin repeat domain-containing protein [Flavobacterium agricola]|uniref:Ankyrin repeat domain-containing protein n=1 Tax=Flavobacterium agricola TaxID=2870839 RepID=A0ABY6M499_9FLAO|nr:ankyrin repeat domain-containing protein [Flavobacterium agricola]UYW02413.1 ankyrin repeat domain-containing protein [Flavobacterium agricola]
MKNVLMICLIAILSSCDASTTPTDMNAKNIIELVNANNINGVKEALEAGANVNTTDNQNRNLLLLATLNSNTAMAKLLVEHGADVNMQAKNLDSAFLYAGASGQTELVKLYLANGARFDVFNRYYGSALIPACERGHVETVRVLATTPNYPIDHINRLGWTGLLEAVILGDGSKNYQEIVNILIENGSDISIGDRSGVTALEHAKAKRQTKIIEILTNVNK